MSYKPVTREEVEMILRVFVETIRSHARNNAYSPACREGTADRQFYDLIYKDEQEKQNKRIKDQQKLEAMQARAANMRHKKKEKQQQREMAALREAITQLRNEALHVNEVVAERERVEAELRAVRGSGEAKNW